MKTITAMVLTLMLAGCATMPPQVNRAAKADKYAVPKAAKVEQPTPNQTVKQRWFPKFKIKWLHPK